MIALLPAPSGDCHIVNLYSTTLLSVDWQSGEQHTCLTLSQAADSLLIFGCVEPPSPSMRGAVLEALLRLICILIGNLFNGHYLSSQNGYLHFVRVHLYFNTNVLIGATCWYLSFFT